MSAKKKPEPWRLFRYSDGRVQIQEGQRDVTGIWPDEKRRIADAERIVRAVNSHEELLAALKKARRIMGNGGTWSDVVETVDSVITKAEGKGKA